MQGRVEQDRAGQSRAGQGRAEQGRAGQSREALINNVRSARVPTAREVITKHSRAPQHISVGLKLIVGLQSTCA